MHVSRHVQVEQEKDRTVDENVRSSRRIVARCKCTRSYENSGATIEGAFTESGSSLGGGLQRLPPTCFIARTVPSHPAR